MVYYAIRRKSDNAFLPAIVGKRGSTQAEPSITLPPRLFRRSNDARRALKWWSEGVWRCHRSGGVNYFGECDYDEELMVDKADDRDPNDMEVILLKLEHIVVYRITTRRDKLSDNDFYHHIQALKRLGFQLDNSDRSLQFWFKEVKTKEAADKLLAMLSQWKRYWTTTCDEIPPEKYENT